MNIMSESTRSAADKFIRSMYVLGIVAGVLVAFAPYVLPIAERYVEINIPTIKRHLRLWFLIGSISHVLFLAFLSSVSKSVDKTAAGTRVQTAGYLHTLAAFVMIFSQVQHEFTLDIVLYPMGAALITSICGWFFGGEILASARLSSKYIQDEAEKLAKELDGFRYAIRKIHEDYVETIRKANDEFAGLHQKQSEMYQKILDLNGTAEKLVAALKSVSNEMKSNFGDEFKNSVSEVSENFDTLKYEVKKCGTAARDVATYLAQSQVLVQQMEDLFDMIKEKKESA